MILHPLTAMVVAMSLVISAVALPASGGGMFLVLWMIVIHSLPSRTESRLTVPFLKMLIVAAISLFLIQGVEWFPFGISDEGVIRMMVHFIRISAPIVAIMFLSRFITSEELYGFLLDIHIPPVIILILFRVCWLVPRLRQRMDEVVVAQKLRGMRIESPRQRIMAILPTLSPIFSSMFDETSEHSVAISARGFLDPGPKSHMHVLIFRTRDVVVIALMILIAMGAVWY